MSSSKTSILDASSSQKAVPPQGAANAAPVPLPGASSQKLSRLGEFWASKLREVEALSGTIPKPALPIARIRKIMKSADEHGKMMSVEAPVLMEKACELFIVEMTLHAWRCTEENQRCTLQKPDIATAQSRTSLYDFLVDIVPQTSTYLKQQEAAQAAQLEQYFLRLQQLHHEELLKQLTQEGTVEGMDGDIGQSDTGGGAADGVSPSGLSSHDDAEGTSVSSMSVHTGVTGGAAGPQGVDSATAGSGTGARPSDLGAGLDSVPDSAFLNGAQSMSTLGVPPAMFANTIPTFDTLVHLGLAPQFHVAPLGADALMNANQSGALYQAALAQAYAAGLGGVAGAPLPYPVPGYGAPMPGQLQPSAGVMPMNVPIAPIIPQHSSDSGPGVAAGELLSLNQGGNALGGSPPSGGSQHPGGKGKDGTA